MSKKDKSKFHRRLRAEILKQMEQTPKIVSPQIPNSTQETISKPTIQPSKAAEPPSSPIATPVISTNTDSLMLVRRDLKKSAIIIGSIIILIIALYFIDLKTNILVGLSNGIFEALHLRT